MTEHVPADISPPLGPAPAVRFASFDLTATQAVVAIIVATTAARLIFAASIGYAVDEAYMVGNARIFDLSYVDHPPLHVWLGAAMIRLFGSEAPFLVRLPFIALFAGSIWLLYRLTARLFGERAGLWAVVAFNLAPVFSVIHSTFFLPDGPLIFFLLAAASVLTEILFGKPSRPLAAWFAVGVLAGLALLSKYSAALPIAGIFLFLLTTRSGRPWLATPGPWLAGIVAVLVFTPAIVWNLDHGMVGFGFQAGRVGGPSGRALDHLLTNVLGQMAYLLPWILIPLAISLARALIGGPRREKEWFLALPATVTVGLFLAATLGKAGMPHWPMPGWLFAFPLLGKDLASLAELRPRLTQWAAGIGAGLLALVVGVASVQASGHGIPQSAFRGWGFPDPSIELHDWSDLPAKLAARGLLTPDLVVASPSWITAGRVSQALGPNIPVLCLCDEPHHFPFRFDPRAAEGRDVLLITGSGARTRWTPSLDMAFSSVTPLGSATIDRGGEPVVSIDLALGKSLHLGPK